MCENVFKLFDDTYVTKLVLVMLSSNKNVPKFYKEFLSGGGIQKSKCVSNELLTTTLIYCVCVCVFVNYFGLFRNTLLLFKWQFKTFSFLSVSWDIHGESTEKISKENVEE